MIVCKYLGIGGIVHYILSQVLRLSAILSHCQIKIVKSKCATTYKCYNSSCGDLLEIFGGLLIIKLKLAN